MRSVVAALLLLCSCASQPSSNPVGSNPVGPYLMVLGTAQDGGYPQLGCEQPLCRAAHRDPSLRRYVASAMIVDPDSGQRWLLDATPDLREQVALARGHAGPEVGAPGRPPLFDGIFLTHAHMGHYTGLMHLGRESYGTETTPVYATEKMGAYLAGHGPWSLLFDAGHLRHVRLVMGEAVRLTDELSVTAFQVPHRPEFSDTVGFLVQGPSAAVLFLPDIDKWERWDQPVEEWIARADVALLDGTFFDGEELPGRDMAEIPHPFVVESMARFAPLPPGERSKVRFFHLNHSNPIIDPNSAQHARVLAAGMGVARDGDVVKL